MNNGNAILAAVLSLRDASEQNFNRVDVRLDRLETGFDALERRLDAMDRR